MLGTTKRSCVNDKLSSLNNYSELSVKAQILFTHRKRNPRKETVGQFTTMGTSARVAALGLSTGLPNRVLCKKEKVLVQNASHFKYRNISG